MLPSRYYSKSESEALAWLSTHVTSRRVDKSQHVSSNSYRGFEGRTESSTGTGRSLEQPLFKPPNSLATSKESELKLEWGQEESTAAPAATPHMVRVYEDDGPDDSALLALSDLEHQYMFWAEDGTENINDTPPAGADATQQTQTAHYATSTTSDTTETGAPTNEPKGMTMTSQMIAEYRKALMDETKDEKTGTAKRVATIAKARAKPSTSTSNILTSTTPLQRRAAQQKNRYRRSNINAPMPPSPQKQPSPKPNSTKVELRYDNTPEGHRTAINIAIEQGFVDPNNEEEIAALRKAIGETPSCTSEEDLGELDEHITNSGHLDQDMVTTTVGLNDPHASDENNTAVLQNGCGGAKKGKGRKGSKKSVR